MDISCSDSVFIMAWNKISTQFNGHVCILMGMNLINVHELNSLLFCGHDLPNNGHYLRVFPIVMAIVKEKQNKDKWPH